MRIAIAIAFLSAAILTSCATASTVALPGGGQGFAIKCPDPKQCYNKAAEMCAPGVYELVTTNATGTGAVVNGYGSFGTETTLIVRCKAQ